MSQTSLLSFKQLVQHGHLHPSSYQNHLEVSFLDDVRCLRCRPVIVPSLWFFFGVFFWVSRIMLSGFPVIYLYKPYIYITGDIVIWATVNIWYIAPSHQFLKSVLSFFRFWDINKCFFLKSVLSFSKPQLNFQKKNVSNTTLH